VRADAGTRRPTARRQLLAALRADAILRAPDAPALEIVIGELQHHRLAPPGDESVGERPQPARAGLGARPVRARIETGRRYGDAFHRLVLSLSVLRSQAYGEVRRRSGRVE
jgi:hypothetical protein